MKKIEVAAGIVCQDNRILATQRGYGEFKDGWEFPGGKLEPGENAIDALKRELQEELDMEVVVDSLLETVEYDYPQFHITMHCYLCRLAKAEFVLKEHEAARWLEKRQLDDVAWLPADEEIINKLKMILP